MSTAQEPVPYGYAGEGTVPDRRSDDDLEDTAENIAIPGGDLTTALTEATEDVDEDDEEQRRLSHADPAPRAPDRERQAAARLDVDK